MIKEKKGAHYVCNRTFTVALHEYSQACRVAENNGEALPQMSNYLGECILKMSQRLSLSPRFRNYPYREEMVGNAIVAAVKYCHKFDGTRFNNGFAYVTQILFSHMVQTIKKEKKIYEGNMKLISNAEMVAFGIEEMDGVIAEHAATIVDQKLKAAEESRTDDGPKKGFRLVTGYTKADRAAYNGGTALEDK